jgi:hypothetical protein
MSIMYETHSIGKTCRDSAMHAKREGRVRQNAAHPPIHRPLHPPPHTSMPVLPRPDSALVAATTLVRTAAAAVNDLCGFAASFCCASVRCADFSERCASRPNCTTSARDCVCRRPHRE